MDVVARGATVTRTLESLQPVLSSILGEVPSVLIDDPVRQTLLDCADTLPRILSRHSLGLELQLQGPSTGSLFVASVPSALRGDPATWHVPRAYALGMLEFDASQAATGESPPPPWVCLVPRNAGDGQDAPHADPFGLLSALARINGAPLDHRMCFEFKSLLEALPAGAELYAARALLSREWRRAPHIAFRGFAEGDIKPFLSATGRKREAKTLKPVAKALARTSTHLGISLALNPESDCVGLEVHADGSLPAGDRGGWEALLTALIARRLADADRVDAALRLISAVGGDHPTVRLSHVTITTVDGAPVATKIHIRYDHVDRVLPAA